MLGCESPRHAGSADPSATLYRSKLCRSTAEGGIAAWLRLHRRRPRPATIRTVAERAGVSKSLVSLVLRGSTQCQRRQTAGGPAGHRRTRLPAERDRPAADRTSHEHGRRPAQRPAQSMVHRLPGGPDVRPARAGTAHPAGRRTDGPAHRRLAAARASWSCGSTAWSWWGRCRRRRPSSRQRPPCRRSSRPVGTSPCRGWTWSPMTTGSAPNWRSTTSSNSGTPGSHTWPVPAARSPICAAGATRTPCVRMDCPITS